MVRYKRQLSTRGPHALTGAQVCRYSPPTSRFPL